MENVVQLTNSKNGIISKMESGQNKKGKGSGRDLLHKRTSFIPHAQLNISPLRCIRLYWGYAL